MNDSRETHTLDERGKALTVEQQGHSFPADYSFECVNAYVHAHDRQFEELQWLALGMANEIERLNALVIRQRKLEAQLQGEINHLEATVSEK